MVLPSKRVIPLLLACIVAVGSIAAAVLYSPKKATTSPILQVLARPETQVLIESDADGDGLKDWEEALWGSDKNNADTDGDGTKDGDEVKIGRNPAIKAPYDTVEIESVPESIAKNETTVGSLNTVPTSETDRVARDLFSAYINLKQSGGEITPEVEAQLVERIIMNGSYTASSPRTYSSYDLKIKKDESTQAIKNYGNAVGKAIRTYAPKPEDAELPTLELALQVKDEKQIAKLGILVASYRAMLKGLLAVEVPESATIIHLSTVNNLSRLASSVEAMQKIYTDPIVTLSAIQGYTEIAEDSAKTQILVRNYFATRNVSYGAEEDGFWFVYTE